MYISRCRWLYIAVVVLLVIIGYPIKLKADNTGAVPKITVAEVEKLLNSPDVVIIDVRKNKSWWRSTTKISGAVREDPSNASQWADKYPKDKTLIVYCD
jgi:hypothetical protein